MHPSAEEFKTLKFRVDDSYENFIVAQPPQFPEDVPFDPYGQLSHMIRKDWREYCPEGKQPCALIIDTFSEAGEDVQRFVGQAGRGNAGIGEVYGLDPDNPWDPDSLRMSQMNDYGKSQDQVIALLKLAMRQEQYPHVIILGHRKEEYEEKMVKQGAKWVKERIIKGYDMAVPGRKWLGNMTKFTEQYLFHTNEGYGELDIRLHLHSDGKHYAKYRTTDTSMEHELEVPFSYEGMADTIRKVAKGSRVDMGSTDIGLRLVAYGMGGTGKTMLWTSLPEETFAIGPAVYMPYDPSAARLTSVWDELRNKKAA